jgi:hypothetical protein
MTEQPHSNRLVGSLTIGNIATIAVRLYKNHFKEYFGLSALSAVWTIIPVYGWARSAAIQGAIARLAFGDLTGDRESSHTAMQHTNQRMWSFLGISLLVWLPFTLFLFGINLVLAPLENPLWISILSSVLSGVLALIYFPLLFLAEVILAVEGNILTIASIKRNWQLSRRSIWRIQRVMVLAFIMTLPVTALTDYLPELLRIIFPEPSMSLSPINLILLSVMGAVIVNPFWQAIKAVLYCDLRNRQEGLDLNFSTRYSRN